MFGSIKRMLFYVPCANPENFLFISVCVCGRELLKFSSEEIQISSAAAVMANTAIATAGDVQVMAEAFKKAIEAGRSAYLSGLGRTLDKGASASSPLTGFLHD